MSLNIPTDKDSPAAFLNVDDKGTARMVTKKPTECPQCKTIHYFFIQKIAASKPMVCLDCGEP